MIELNDYFHFDPTKGSSRNKTININGEQILVNDLTREKLEKLPSNILSLIKEIKAGGTYRNTPEGWKEKCNVSPRTIIRNILSLRGILGISKENKIKKETSTTKNSKKITYEKNFFNTLNEVFQEDELKDFVIEPESNNGDNILKKLEIRKRNRPDAKNKFIILNKDNLNLFISKFFSVDEKELNPLEVITSNKDFDQNKLIELFALVKMIQESKSTGIILPLDERYGFADYFTYDINNPDSENKTAISIKNTKKGGRSAALSGIESTFNYNFDHPLDDENSENKAKIIERSFYSKKYKKRYEERVKKLIKKCIDNRIKNGNKKSIEPTEVREEIENRIKQEVIRAARAYMLLKGGEFNENSFKEFRLIDGELQKISINPKNVRFEWILDTNGLPKIGYKFYTDKELEEEITRGDKKGQKRVSGLSLFSSSIQKAVQLLKPNSKNFSEAGFKKFMRENKIWQAI